MGSKKIRNSEVNRFLCEFEGKDLTDLDNIKDISIGQPVKKEE